MASGYAALENDGKYRNPTCIVKITDADGNDICVSDQAETVVYKENAARMMTDMLVSVVKEGTGKGLAISEMPCAGKTGTTNDNKDGWFVGYTRYYTTSVWVGYDMPKELPTLKGSSYPGNIWHDFMENIHSGLTPMDFLPYVSYSGNGQKTDAQSQEVEDKKTDDAPKQEENQPSQPTGEQPPAQQPASGEQGVQQTPAQQTPASGEQGVQQTPEQQTPAQQTQAPGEQSVQQPSAQQAQPTGEQPPAQQAPGGQSEQQQIQPSGEQSGQQEAQEDAQHMEEQNGADRTAGE